MYSFDHLSNILARSGATEQPDTVMLIWQDAVERLVMLYLHLLCPIWWPAHKHIGLDCGVHSRLFMRQHAIACVLHVDATLHAHEPDSK